MLLPIEEPSAPVVSQTSRTMRLVSELIRDAAYAGLVPPDTAMTTARTATLIFRDFESVEAWAKWMEVETTTSVLGGKQYIDANREVGRGALSLWVTSNRPVK